jgi:hypothetical protein
MDRLGRRVQGSVCIGLVVVIAGACSSSGAPASQAAATAPQASSGQPSVEASQAPASVGPASAPASAGSKVAADPDKKYECKKLITDAEMQQATGLDSAEFFHQEWWTDTPGLPEGQTYCQFFANSGGIAIALTVATGPAFTFYEQAAGAATDLVELPGIGDHAVYSSAAHFAAARKGGTLLLLKFQDMSGSGLPKGLDVQSASGKVLQTAVGRI